MQTDPSPSLDPYAFPDAGRHLEEACALDGRDWAATFGFGLARLKALKDERPLLIAAPRPSLTEFGWPFAQGASRADPARLLLAAPAREAQALWALEEGLKSGALAGGIVLADKPDFVMTRRLEFAAKAGGAMAMILRPRPPTDLSAARLRWRIAALPSAGLVLDPKAPGHARMRAELVRRRDGPPAIWEVEVEDETHHLRLAARLAGDGLVADSRTIIAA
jgi:protein ImuA